MKPRCQLCGAELADEHRCPVLLSPWGGHVICAGGCGQALTTEEERRGNLCEGCATR